jgi:hypothetical protein
MGILFIPIVKSGSIITASNFYPKAQPLTNTLFIVADLI